MNRILFLLLVLLLAQNRWSTAAEVTENEGDFKYQVPPDWTVEKPDGEQYRAVVGRNSDGKPANAHFYVERFAGSLRQFATAYFEQSAPVTAARGVKNFEVGNLSDFTSRSGLIGLRAVARGTFDGIAGKEHIYFFDLGSGRKVMAVCAFPKDEIGYGDIFDSMMFTLTRSGG